MNTKEERYQYMLSEAERLFIEGQDARAEIALAICREIRADESCQHCNPVSESVLRRIRQIGQGTTSRELVQTCRPFKALSPRQRADLLDSMTNNGTLERVASGRTVRYIERARLQRGQ